MEAALADSEATDATLADTTPESVAEIVDSDGVPASDVCWLVWGRLHEYASENGRMKALELFNVLDKVG